MKKYTVAIAGTTHRTRQCAKTLLNSDLFEVIWVLTPGPKPVGRKQILTLSPMNIFANSNMLPAVLVDKKIDQKIKNEIDALPKPDFLLVVDFGYIVPNWLLNVPKIAPLNIHPSELPRWRGSSPGQFSILFGDKKSAVTLMVMDEKLDHGPIIHQDFFDVDPSWDNEDYYKHAFNIMCDGLDTKITNFAKKHLNKETKNQAAKTQPDESPTITARTIKKQQTFIPWEHIKMAMKGLCPTDLSALSKLLQTAYKNNGQFAFTLERASKAFNPWPHLWTIIPTAKGEKRMKIIETIVEETSSEKKLILKTVQIEGKKPTKWNEVKNVISAKN